MKKMILFSAAGLLATASIVFAAVKADKSAVSVKKEKTIKLEKKHNAAYKSHCSHYCTGTM